MSNTDLPITPGARVIKGNNNIANQGDNSTVQQILESTPRTDSETITQEQAVELLQQIKEMIGKAEWPDTEKTSAVLYLDTATLEAKKPEPDKSFVRANLERVLMAVKTIKTLVENVTPLFTKIAGWLG